MTPQEISAVATTLDLIRKHPPKDESWNKPYHPTLAGTLQAWLKEQL